MLLKKYIPFACLTLVLAACNSEQKATTEDTATQDTTAAAAESGTTPATTATAPERPLSALPPTSDVPVMLQLTGADFNQGLINQPAKATKYTTTNDKAALNLGVYATDIGYLSVYDKTQDVITYLKSAEKLSDHLGISNTFGKATQDRFQKNLSNKDSLVKIVDETMAYVNTNLKEGDRDATAALIVAGSFIEGLHISTGLIEKYPKDVPADVRNQTLTQLIVSITKQEKSLDDLINILQSADQNETVKSYLAQLQDLKKQFEALDMDEKIKNNQGNLAVTDQTLAGITAKVKEIRAKIVA